MNACQVNLEVLDDERDMCRLVCDVAECLGMCASTPESPQAFIDNYGAGKDLVVLDLNMPGCDGVELLRFMAGESPPAAIILISGEDQTIIRSAQKLAEALQLNIVGTLQKPFSVSALKELLRRGSGCVLETDANAVSNATPSEEDLRLAIKNRSFEVVFQPQFATRDNESVGKGFIGNGLVGNGLIGMEALARWQHPRLGAVSPGVFIPLAESLNCVYQIDQIVLGKAIEPFSRFRNIAGVKLSVNMSSLDLLNLDLPEQIMAGLSCHHINPEQLQIEITETAFMPEQVCSLDILTRLRLKGIHLSIDDFGTGFSSMQQLVRVPFSELKIDASFVEAMITDPSCRAVVKTSISLAHELGMEALAEGVSSPELLAAVTALGCDKTQGYHLGRPMPIADIEALM